MDVDKRGTEIGYSYRIGISAFQEDSMDPRLNIVTLGVRNLNQSLRFYRDGLGWKPSVATGDFILFELGGAALALYPRNLLAKDARVAPAGTGFSGVTFAQNVASRGDVDPILAAACDAGATLLRAASEKEWGGYSGYFADPDGNPWEVAWNPHFKLDSHGRLVF
jgi:catechol 2,3-dioxygenase-like lactoylglutathione lyase family enzyme